MTCSHIWSGPALGPKVCGMCGLIRFYAQTRPPCNLGAGGKVVWVELNGRVIADADG